jgi:hypothetical protein
VGIGLAESVRVLGAFAALRSVCIMKLPRLADAPQWAGVRAPIVCASVNKIGFRMCGGVDVYRDVIDPDAVVRLRYRVRIGAQSRRGRLSSGPAIAAVDPIPCFHAKQYPAEQGSDRIGAAS